MHRPVGRTRRPWASEGRTRSTSSSSRQPDQGAQMPYDTGALERVIDDVVAPGARQVDETGKFPSEAVVALSHAGLLAPCIGLAAAADVIRRLAGACGSTAMVALMHYAGAVVVENHGPS